MFWNLLAAAVACDGVDNASIRTMLDTAEAAYTALDLPAFNTELGRAQSSFACLVVAVELDNAARLHQLIGLRAFTDKDLDLATRSFAAARVVDPERDLPTALAPVRHPVRALFGFDLSDAPPVTVAVPREGTLILDGRETLRHRVALPTLFQHRVGTRVTEGQYLYPMQKLPDYAVATRSRLGVHLPLLVAGGAAMAVGGVLLAVYTPKARDAKRGELMTTSERVTAGFDDITPRKVKAIKTMGIVAPVMVGVGAGWSSAVSWSGPSDGDVDTGRASGLPERVLAIPQSRGVRRDGRRL